MPAAVVASSNSLPELSPAEGRLWCELIERRCGLHFPESQWRYLRRRLWERMALSSISTYSQYYRVIAEGGRPEEWRSLLEDLLNPETSFFRHQPSFKALTAALQNWRAGKPRELWSAGCSTGEEAYSMAMTAAAASAPVEIVGTDLNRRVLERARAGIFSARQVAAVPPAWKTRFLKETAKPDEWQVADGLRERVKFDTFQLLDTGTYPKREFDAIFCCNVLIYFSTAARQDAASGLLGRLKPGGYLFIAPGECTGLNMPEAELTRLEGTQVWRRNM